MKEEMGVAYDKERRLKRRLRRAPTASLLLRSRRLFNRRRRSRRTRAFLVVFGCAFIPLMGLISCICKSSDLSFLQDCILHDCRQVRENARLKRNKGKEREREFIRA